MSASKNKPANPGVAATSETNPDAAAVPGMKQKLSLRLSKGWITREQVERYAAIGAITESELKEILGEE